MEVYLLIAGIALAVWLYPYLRILVKRLILRGKLRRACKIGGSFLIPAHRFWFLGRRRGATVDFYVETPNCVYPVKLFGMKRRGQTLVFDSGGRYVVRHYMGLMGMFGRGRISMDSKPKPLPAYNFRAGFRQEWYLKSIRPILLLNPTCLEVRAERERREIIIGSGEAFSGMTLFTLPRFLGELDGSHPS